jgi:hypothetical protein
MSDDSTYQTIEAEGIDHGDPAPDEEYPEGYDDLEPDPDDDNVLLMEDGEGKADPADVLALVREQAKERRL